MPEIDQQIRSDEVQDILGVIPNWVIRWGITVIMLVILVIILGSFIFKYPDIVQASAVITTTNPPAGIVARTDGKIDSLFISDQELVSKNQVLAIVHNPAEYNDIQLVKLFIDTFRNDPILSDSGSLVKFNQDMKLGDVQVFYGDFVKKYYDFVDFISINYHVKKIRALNDQMKKYDLYYERLYSQRNILEEEMKIAEEQHKRNGELFNKGVISKKEYEESKSKFLEKRFNFEGARTQLADTKIKLDELNQQILDLELAFNKESKEIVKSLNESIDILENQIVFWEQKYLLISPIKGTISFTRIWSKNQNVNKGDIVFTVVPDSEFFLIGRMNVPVKKSGKLKKGQRINLKFSSFPYMEYGIVEARIKSISLVPDEDQVYVEITLPDGLKTNYGKVLPFNQQMQANAEIITEDLKLIQKIFYPVKSLMNR